MSAHYGYGGQAGKDALIFAYDTGDTENSYKGEPTTNLSTITLSQMGTDGSGQGSVGTRTILSPNHVRIVDINSNTRQSQVINGLTGGTTYTISVEFKKITGTPTFRFQIQNYLNGAYQSTIKFTNTAETGIVDKEGWQTASWTFTLGAGMNGVRIWYQDGADYTTYTHSFELRNPQLEAKAHPTPYTPPGTTRSATQGLLDLTSGNGLDLTDTSFNSSAQIDFDGASALMYSPELPVLDSFTLETIFKPDSVGGWLLYRNSSMNYAGNADNFTLGFTGGNLYGQVEYDPSGADVIVRGTSSIQTGVYSHGIFTYDNSTRTLKIYVNGVLENTSTHSGDSYPYRSTKKMSIGADGGSNHGGVPGNKAFFNGQIPVTKVYNRALTAAEVKNNYNNFKGRFNI